MTYENRNNTKYTGIKMFALFSLLVVVTLSILITRIAAVALTHTGLSRESARFQARSAFTGVGFTTSESEQVVNHPLRRRILLTLMLLGNAGIISAVSTLILSFINPNENDLFNVKILILITGLIVLWRAAQSDWIDQRLSRIINYFLNRYTRLDIKDYYSLLHLSDNYKVSEIKVETDDWIANRTLGESKLRDEGILILGVQRKNGDYIGAPKGHTKVLPEDTLTLYGRSDMVESLDKRRKGSLGDQAHEDAVIEQNRIIKGQSRY